MAAIPFKVNTSFLSTIFDYCTDAIKSYCFSKNFVFYIILFPFFLLGAILFAPFALFYGLIELCIESDILALLISLPCYVLAFIFGVLAFVFAYPVNKILDAYFNHKETRGSKTQINEL